MFGKKAAATVDIYEDFGCPVCEQFEQATHALEKDVRANLAQVRYHPISILDGSSPNSTRRGRPTRRSARRTSAPDVFMAYHNLLYGKDSTGKQVQPTEGTAGPTDQQLISLAQDKARG